MLMRVTVNHTCGCSRTYQVADVPPNTLARMVYTLEHQTCGDCRQPRRLLAATAPTNANGHGREER